jgi:hypothetical protein
MPIPDAMCRLQQPLADVSIRYTNSEGTPNRLREHAINESEKNALYPLRFFSPPERVRQRNFMYNVNRKILTTPRKK